MKVDKADRPLAVTVRRAEKLLDLGHTKMYELIKQGRLKTVKVGRRTLVVYTSLEELVGGGAA